MINRTITEDAVNMTFKMTTNNGMTAASRNTTDNDNSTTGHTKTADGETVNPNTNTFTTLKHIGLNAKGFKQSSLYIAELLSDADNVSISETWLRPGELCIIKSTLMNTQALNVLNDEDIVIYAKSGMTTTDPCYVGRHYGGVAVACKQRKYMQYTELDIMSERIIGVKVCNNSDIFEIVVCVYMPFYNGEAHQTDCYAETIDVLQSVIEQFGAICPIHIIGDLNAQLQKRRMLLRRWYRLSGFNTHSSILYDFINDNDLCVADFIDPQHVQYACARVILIRPKRDHVTPMLLELHWLPVKCRIIFKTLLLTFKCLHGLAPTYLSALLSPYCPTRSLRSSDQLLLNQPTSRTKLGERSFSCAAPRAWNQLPIAVRQCATVNHFKVALKTYLFTAYYFDSL